MSKIGEDCSHHTKGDGSWWSKDGYGIELCRVCDKCEAEKMRGYRQDIRSHYDCDEPIEED